jgi:hypothetical protein
LEINDIINRMGGAKAIAQRLGIDEQQAATGAAALIPSILGGFDRKVQSEPDGVGGFEGILGKVGDFLDGPDSPQSAAVERGNGVLGSIFGSKDVSRSVAQDASARTGLDPSMLKKMLPILAMMVTAYMARQRNKSAQGAGRGNNSIMDIIGSLATR